jgi:hypothetical protein
MDSFPEYHKIQTLFKRDMEAPNHPLILGDWTKPEFEFLKDCQWDYTEKVDGTNIRILVRGDTIQVGGRTDGAMLPAPLLDSLLVHFGARDMKSALLEVFQPDTEVVLYGEGYGPKIQKGGKYRADQGFVLFDVRIGDYWLRRDDVNDIASRLSLDAVPVLGSATLPEIVDLVRAGQKSRWGDFLAEGVVATPQVPLNTRNGARVIAKIKHRDFHATRGSF